MKKYIELEAAKEAARRTECDANYDGARFTAEWVENALDFTPAADVVEVRHGQWIFDFALDGSNFYRCSECGRQECLLEKYNAEKYMPYCHCGARMDGRREEEHNAPD